MNDPGRAGLLKDADGATVVTGETTIGTQGSGIDGCGNVTSRTLNGGTNMLPAGDPTSNPLTSVRPQTEVHCTCDQWSLNSTGTRATSDTSLRMR